MAEPDVAAASPPPETPAQIGLDPALVEQVVAALDAQDCATIQRLV
jgi:hypothetical protein